jgi:hypothetical protein
MPTCFNSAKTAAVELTANLDEQKPRNNKIVRLLLKQNPYSLLLFSVIGRD